MMSGCVPTRQPLRVGQRYSTVLLPVCGCGDDRPGARALIAVNSPCSPSIEYVRAKNLGVDPPESLTILNFRRVVVEFSHSRET